MEGEGGDDSLTGEDGEDYADGGTGSDRCSAETVVSCEVFTMSALALLMADLESGLITVDEFSTLGLVWVFDPDQLPERYQTEYVPPDYGGIDEVTYEVNLFDQQPDLSAETRALIDDAWELTPDYEAAARLLMRGPPRHYNPSSSAAEELSGDDGTMPMGILILAVLAIASAALVGTWWMKRSKRH